MKSARLILVFALAFSPLMAHANDLSAKRKSTETTQASGNQIDWTGFHVGGNFSFNELTNNQTFDLYRNDTPFILSKSNGSGNLFGLQIGYDKQIGNSVIGIQTSFDFGGIGVSDKLAAPYGYILYGSEEPITVCPAIIGCADDVKTRITSLRTFTARAGYLFQSQVLIYVKGGLATANFEYEHITPEQIIGSAEERRTAAVLGGGFEYVVNQNWSMFFEYNRLDFGKKSVELNYSNDASYNWSNDNTLDVVTFGINYNLL